MKALKVDTVVYVDDIEVPVSVWICPAEPDVGIMQEYVDVDSIDLSAVYDHIRRQLEVMPINEFFEDGRY